MQTEARLQRLRLCAVIEDSIAHTEEYITRYEKLLAATRMKRIEDVLDKLIHINNLFRYVYGLVCESESLQATLKAYDLLRKNYERVLILDPPLPGAVRHMYYEVLTILRNIAEL